MLAKSAPPVHKPAALIVRRGQAGGSGESRLA
jgi:hypothetical protein